VLKDRGLKPMLDAAMQRTYSAAPVTFFTGGGDNSFDNFEPWENRLVPTVEFAFENSINCAFVRLMRDIRDYYIAKLGIDKQALLSDPDERQGIRNDWRDRLEIIVYALRIASLEQLHAIPDEDL
jgi:hypothetical protein